MKSQIILTILMGTLIYAGRSQETINSDQIKTINKPNCTYTGVGCPDIPCCTPKYRCQFTIPISLFSLPPELYEQVARNKEWKCLDKVADFRSPVLSSAFALQIKCDLRSTQSRFPLFKNCGFHEECSHVEHAKCLNLTCQCENNYVGTEDNRCVSVNG